MSKEKQMIKEMAKVIKSSLDGLGCGNFNFTGDEISAMFAEALYTEGYRKQKEGEWEKRVFIIFDSEKVGYRCSECNTTWDTATPYCPKCGAKMKNTQN